MKSSLQHHRIWVWRGAFIVVAALIIVGGLWLLRYPPQASSVTDRIVTYTIPDLHETSISKVFDLSKNPNGAKRIAWLSPAGADDNDFAFATVDEAQAGITTPYQQIYLVSTLGQISNLPLSPCTNAFTIAGDGMAHCQANATIASWIVAGQPLTLSSPPPNTTTDPGFTLQHLLSGNELRTPDGTGIVVVANCIASFWQLDSDAVTARLQATLPLGSLISPGKTCDLANVAWSPTGQQLSFTTGDSHGFIIDATALVHENPVQGFVKIPIAEAHVHDLGANIRLICWQDEQTVVITDSFGSSIQRINLASGSHTTLIQPQEIANTATQICDVAVAAKQHKLAFSLCILVNSAQPTDAHTHIIYHIQPDILYTMGS